MIGQVLYLACEAYGIRGTGMGCLFDDTTHNLLCLQDNAWQDRIISARAWPWKTNAYRRCRPIII